MNDPDPTSTAPAEQPQGVARLDLVLDMVRELSLQTDPQALVATFRRRSQALFGNSASISLSRRNLEAPLYRITRATRWQQEINPWLEPDQLPLLDGGLLGSLLYDNAAKIIREPVIAQNDPAIDYLRHARSLVSLPLYDGGSAINMVVRVSDDVTAFDDLDLADWVLRANLFGRATKSLVLQDQVSKAYDELDRELRRVGEIQESLLPEHLPEIPGVDIAAWYKPAARAGGDYYDFFPIEDGRWGILIADVSGHSTPAAVLMAILRTMLHSYYTGHACPAKLLEFANQRLSLQTRRHSTMFVTAFYGIFDPRTKEFIYSSAGHNPPLLVAPDAGVTELDRAQSLPLAVMSDTEYSVARVMLKPGDTLLLYTDGISEATNDDGDMYGHSRLLSCASENVFNAQHIIDCVTHKLLAWTHSREQADDQTLLALRF